MAQVSSILTYGRWSLDANSAKPETIAYLLQNGFSQSMTDAAAFSKSDKEGKTGEEIAAMADAARQARFEAICAGTVGTRVGGPRLSPVERATRDLVDERLSAICAARKVKMPEGDVLKAARAKIMDRFGDEIKLEAEARVAKAAADAESLADLFDAPEGDAAEAA